MNATHAIAGSGTTTTAGSYVHAWTHGLGTATPQLALFQLVSTSPETWRFVPPNEYDARGTATVLTLTLASTPPTPGHVGALKLLARTVPSAASTGSATHAIPGSGTTTTAGSYVEAWTHGLGAATPQLALFQLVSTSPETWRFVPPNEYDARSTATVLTLTLASTPPTAGHVGALKLLARTVPAAASTGSATHAIPGSGTTTTAGSYVDARTHGLASATPQLALFQLVSMSPETWRFVPPNEYDARSTATVLTLTLASTPPPPGHVGALKLLACAVPAASTGSATSGGLFSSSQLAGVRARASAIIAATFPTTFSIGERVEIPAARWSLARSEKSELSGLLPTSSVAFRVDREALTGITLTEGVTRLTEDGRDFRITQVRDAKGDPGLVLECTAV